MARTLVKEGNARELFLQKLPAAFSETSKTTDKDWNEFPVDIEEFCQTFINEPLFPLQLEFCRKMLGKNPLAWSKRYREGHAFWGKGSGKDRTIAKLLTYVCYKLLCLRNPQKFLRENFSCSVADNSPIDLANMSINAKQAEEVFFKHFKTVIRATINPKTKNNWFEDNGLDTREGYGILSSAVVFPHNITAHSLNSETHIGEGLSTFFAIIDEFGAFPQKNAFNLLESVQSTVTSRYGRYGKVLVLSFKYAENDPMHILFERDKDDDDTFSSQAATWEVNPIRKKDDFAKLYGKNPEKARMMYECKGGVNADNRFIGKPYLLAEMFNPKQENPVVGGMISVPSHILKTMRFQDWFVGKPDTIYTCHIDLSKGKLEEQGDAAGFAIGHCELMQPRYDARLRRELAEEGVYLDTAELAESQKGYVVDLALQIVAPSGSEISFVDIRNFIFHLIKIYKFDIQIVTYDKYGSAESIQILQNAGINAFELSVDKTEKPYVNFKESMYQSLVRCYPHPIAERELFELERLPNGKIDHPQRSLLRSKNEGQDRGSKDVIDAITGVCQTLFEYVSLHSEFYFG